jgi:DNA-binding PadR family transcriptional regulator
MFGGIGLSEHHHHHHHGQGHDYGPLSGGTGMGFGVKRGEFRFLVLIALSEKPMHGYALIQEIGRTYQRPVSAGQVYPTLQEFEDMGLVSSKAEDGKKVYSITTEGERHLEDNKDVVNRLKEGRDYAGKVRQFSFMNDLRDIQGMIMMNAEYIDREKMKKIEETLCESKRKVALIVFGGVES